MSSVTPQPATMEDYDSDASRVMPGTRREARRRQTTSGPPRSIDRYRTAPRDNASDSGYSSRTNGTQGSSASASAAADAAAMPPPPRPAPATSPTKSKPIIHRSDSQRNRPSAPSRSGSTTRQVELCDDPSCTDRNCVNAMNAARRHSASYGYPVQYSPTAYAPSPMHSQPAAQYQYSYATVPQMPTQTVPLVAQPSPRSGSRSRQTRPVSISGYSYSGVPYNATAGPSPADLAGQWQNSPYYQMLQQQRQQQQAYNMASYGTTPPSQPAPVYTSMPTAPASPTATQYPTASTSNRSFSARVAGMATTPSYDTSNVRYGPPLNRTLSARQPARTSRMPGAFPTGDSDSEETDSESDESDYELTPEELECRRRSRARDSRLMSSSSQRRPSINKHYPSAPAVPTQASRDSLRRNPRSDTGLDYVSGSDNFDSDRTARPVIDRARTNYSTSTRSSRRPSLSTTASSGRTKSTNMSSVTSGMERMTVEGRHGRRYEYLSQRDQRQARENALWEAEQRQQQEIEDYQYATAGGRSPVVTAENIASHQRRTVPSASGHSRKSSRAGSKAESYGGTRIETAGGLVIHIDGDNKIELQTQEGGQPKVTVSSTGSSRDSAYHGSKSSSSRVGRSRGSSEAGGSKRRSQKIREEDE